MTEQPRVSVVIPLLNEQEVLPILLQRLEKALAEFGGSYQIIFVDDGSADATRDILADAARRDPRIGVLSFSRNFGHQAAISAGLARASGNAVAVIDGDLQDPPEMIPALCARLAEGFDVVYAVRRTRKGAVVKKACYWLYYRVLKLFARHPIPLDAGDFCILSSRVVRLLNAMPEQDRFLRGLRAWVGFKHAHIEYDRDARHAGASKYSARRLVRLAFDGILSASDKPLRMASLAGFAVSAGAFLFAVWAVVWRLFLGKGTLPGYASIAAGIFFLGGVQLVSIGILGEYIARIYNQVKGRPLYIVDRVQNLPEDGGPGRGAGAG